MKRTKRKWTKSIVVSLVSLLIVGGLPWHELRADANTHGEYDCSPLFVTYDQTATWDLNTQGEFTITNTSETVIDNWTLEIVFATDLDIANLWNGTDISDEITPANTLVIGNETYNATINPGESVSFGIEMVGTELAPVAPTSVTLTNVILEEVQTEEECVSSEEDTEETIVSEEVSEEITDEIDSVEEEIVPASLNEDENAGFSYAIFAESDISFDGWKSTVTGDIYSGGDYLYQGSELCIDGYVRTVGTIQPQGWTTSMTGSTENIETIPMPDWSSLILSEEESMAPLTDEDLTSQNSIVVNGFYRTEGSVAINSAEFGGDVVIVAAGDITLNIDTVSSEGKIILYSETGNITINGSQAVFNGILYAPNGNVFLNAYDITINGMIVADSFSYSGSVLNVNYQDQLADIGNNETENQNENVVEDYPTFSGYLYASENSLGMGIQTQVYFYLSSDIDDVQSVTLYSTVDGAITSMVDDANYYVSGDDIMGDGIYTAKLNILPDTSNDLSYYAIVHTVNGEFVTDECIIRCSDAASDIALINCVNRALHDLYESDEYLLMTNEERIDAFYDLLYDIAENGISPYSYSLVDPDSIEYDVFNNEILFRYSNGIPAFIVVDLPDYSEFADMSTQQYNGNFLLLYSIYPNPVPAGTSGYSNASIRNSDYANMPNLLPDNVESEFIDNFSVSNIRSGLEGHSMVLIGAHGGMNTNPVTGVYETYFTTIDDTVNSNQAALDDIIAGRIAVNAASTGYRIYPEFFSYYYEEGDFDGCIFGCQGCRFLGTTESPNLIFADQMLELGAEAVYGNENKVMIDYGRAILNELIPLYYGGESIGQALDLATDTVAENDDEWYFSIYGCYPTPDDTEPNPGTPHIIGDEEYCLSSRGIVNGNFETSRNSTFYIYGWGMTGDCRIGNQLGPIRPSLGTHMAMISTGIGSGQRRYLSGSDESYISQSVMLPDNAEELVFSYNLVSEEPMEYVGSVFDDTFIVIIAPENGDPIVVEQNSINTAHWNSVSGINFAGGDNTVYQTGWQERSVPVSEYAGENITIYFVVSDTGDSAYDTMALIDNVYLA